MDNSYNVKVKKGDFEVEVFSHDKEFVSNKFSEVLVAIDKSEAFKLQDANGKPGHVSEQIVEETANNEPVKSAETVQPEPVAEVSQTVDVTDAAPAVEAVAEQPIVEVSNAVEPVEVAAEQPVAVQEPAEVIVSNEPEKAVELSQPATVETVQAVEQPVQEVPVNNEAAQTAETVQPEPVAEVSQTVDVTDAAPAVEAVAEQQVVNNEVAQAPQLGKSALAKVAEVNEDDLLKVYEFKNDGFKAHKEFNGTTGLKQIHMTKLVLIASEYVKGVSELSGKALGKHMKGIGTKNLATNLKKDNGIVKDKGYYRLNDAGKNAALNLIRDLCKN